MKANLATSRSSRGSWEHYCSVNTLPGHNNCSVSNQLEHCHCDLCCAYVTCKAVHGSLTRYIHTAVQSNMLICNDHASVMPMWWALAQYNMHWASYKAEFPWQHMKHARQMISITVNLIICRAYQCHLESVQLVSRSTANLMSWGRPYWLKPSWSGGRPRSSESDSNCFTKPEESHGTEGTWISR